MNEQEFVKKADVLLKNMDGWSNAYTGIGMVGRDKTKAATINTAFMTQATLDALYQSDETTARIIDREPKEMCREGFELKIMDETDPEVGDAAMEKFETLGGMQKFEKSLRWGNLYGTGMVFIGMAKDDPTKPLFDDNGMTSGNPIEYLAVLDRYMITAGSTITEDLSSQNFGRPEDFTLVSGKVGAGSVGSTFHWSRGLRFDGRDLPQTLLMANNYFGDSILSSCYNAISKYNQVNDTVALIMQDVVQCVIKLKNLSDMIASGNIALVTKRFELLSRMSSVLNTIIIEEGEEYDKKTPSLAGIDILLKAAGDRLVACTSIPHTILLGESPSGLGATGDSEKADWFDHIRNLQQSKLLNPLYTLFDVIFSEKGGVSKGVIPKYKINFKPLWQMSEKENAEIKKIMSDADCAYIGANVLTAEEVADSRFADEYSLDTNLDKETREALEVPDLEPEPEPEAKTPEQIAEEAALEAKTAIEPEPKADGLVKHGGKRVKRV